MVAWSRANVKGRLPYRLQSADVEASTCYIHVLALVDLTTVAESKRLYGLELDTLNKWRLVAPSSIEWLSSTVAIN